MTDQKKPEEMHQPVSIVFDVGDVHIVQSGEMGIVIVGSFVEGEQGKLVSVDFHHSGMYHAEFAALLQGAFAVAAREYGRKMMEEILYQILDLLPGIMDEMEQKKSD